MSLQNHYKELKADPNLTLWDGNISKIPEDNTLVAFQTSSSGLVNGVVTGYSITWVRDTAQIRIKLKYPNTTTTNERMLEELELPMADREQGLREKEANPT